MKKNPKLTAMTRQNFIEAFCQLAQTKSVEKITVRELTQLAGYNRSTFYQYFDDVPALMTTIEDRILAQIMQNFERSFEQGTLAERFVVAFSQAHDDLADYYEVVLNSSEQTTFTKRLKALIMNRLVADYQLPATDVRLMYLVDFELSGVIAVVYRWINQNRDLSAKELAQLIRGMIDKGLAPQLIALKRDNIELN